MTQENTQQPSPALAPGANSHSSSPAAGEPAEPWDMPIRCTVFSVVEKTKHPGEAVTLAFDDEGSLFLELPGHGLPRDLVRAAALAVVRAEDRAQEAGVAIDKESQLDRDLQADGETTEGEHS